MADDDIILTKQFAGDSKVFVFYLPGGERSQYLRESIQHRRFWEYGAHRRILQIARARMPNGAFVDVGAGLGTETIIASEVFKLLYAFEVDPANIPYIGRNIELNQILGYVTERCIAERTGEKIWIDQSQVSVGASAKLYSEEVSDGHLVETLALGDYPFKQEIAFLNVDVEGMEGRVLLGAARTIQGQGKTPLIRFTFNPSRMKQFESTASDLIKFFEIFDYHLFISSPVQLAPISFTALQLLFDDWKNLQSHPWLTFYAFPESSKIYANTI